MTLKPGWMAIVESAIEALTSDGAPDEDTEEYKTLQLLEDARDGAPKASAEVATMIAADLL